METDLLLVVLHKAGMRVTPQRLAIGEYLYTTEDHPTADQIYAQLKNRYPSLSLTTVYNTLDVLVAMGVVNAIGSVGDDKVHFDGNVSPHINLACQVCHQIFDLDSECVNELESEIHIKSGFEIKGSRILYFGTCPSCITKR